MSDHGMKEKNQAQNSYHTENKGLISTGCPAANSNNILSEFNPCWTVDHLFVIPLCTPWSSGFVPTYFSLLSHYHYIAPLLCLSTKAPLGLS